MHRVPCGVCQRSTLLSDLVGWYGAIAVCSNECAAAVPTPFSSQSRTSVHALDACSRVLERTIKAASRARYWALRGDELRARADAAAGHSDATDVQALLAAADTAVCQHVAAASEVSVQVTVLEDALAPLAQHMQTLRWEGEAVVDLQPFISGLAALHQPNARIAVDQVHEELMRLWPLLCVCHVVLTGAQRA